MVKNNKPILCLDFDGVIHSYTSGWKGASVIPDPPVQGALQFIVEALPFFRVAIFSSRTHQWGGRRAMRRWLSWHLQQLSEDSFSEWWENYVVKHAGMEPWEVAVHNAVDQVMHAIEFPWVKPSAKILLDDRAIQFNGLFPAICELQEFQPWNRRAR